MRIRLFVLMSVLVMMTIAMPVLAQERVPRKPTPEPMGGWQPTMLVDCPTAGTIKRGTFNVVMQAYPEGGILGETNIGMSNRLMLGVSYGSARIISEDKPEWDPSIEFSVKLNLVDEGLVFPAASVGFCSQGFGMYHDDKDRYDFKSKGFYAVGSKNYAFQGREFGLHGGINYSMEDGDGDKNASFFLGSDIRINRDVGLVLEYDFATNDNKDTTSFGEGQGYLNLSLQWLYAENLAMEFLIKNLNNNRSLSDSIWRGFRVTYIEHF